MNNRMIGIVTLLTAAGASLFALTQGTLSADNPTTVIETPTVSTESTPCAYMWATQSLPEISEELQAALKTVLPESEARASAYGEDCVAADGSSTFSAMETDFYVRILVTDLDDDDALGNIIEQVLHVIDQFPRPRVPGGQAGFVEFTFRNGDQQRILRVPILRGMELRQQGLHGEELIQAMETQ